MKNSVQHHVRPGLVELFVERARDDEAHVHVCAPDRVEETLADVLGRLPTVVGRRFPLAEAAAAHRAVESRDTIGKTVLVP